MGSKPTEIREFADLLEPCCEIAGFAYTVASGRLFMDISRFHEFSEALLGRPILTHEFADEQTWSDLRNVLEQDLTERAQT